MSLKIGIVLLPDRATATLLMVLSEVARDTGNTMVLNTGPDGPRPHLSLFHMMVNGDDLPAIGMAIKALLVPEWIGGTCFKRHLVGGQWLFLQANGDGLLDLQHQVVDMVAHRRTGNVEVAWQMSEAQQAAYTRYGYPNVGEEAWDIHFTYGYIPQSADPLLQDIRTGYEIHQPWRPAAVAVVRIGDNGTAMEILYLRHLTDLARPPT